MPAVSWPHLEYLIKGEPVSTVTSMSVVQSDQ